MYNDDVMKRFKAAKNAGTVKGANAKGEAGNIQCGDMMRLTLLVEDGVIKDAKFKTYGCVAAIVSTDIACDLIVGKTVEDALAVTNKDVLKIMGEIPPQKVHCSVMAQEVIAAAVKDYRKSLAKKKKG